MNNASPIWTPALRMSRPGATNAEGVENGQRAQSILLNYWRLALRRRWLILSIVLAGVIAAFVVTMLMTPQYQATATIEIARQEKNIVAVEALEPAASPADMEFYETQYSLLEARSLAERVAKTLQLGESTAFFEAFDADPDGSLFEEGGPRRTTTAQRREREEAAIDILLENIEIEPVRGSALVDVSFTSPDATLSQRIANAWTQQFIASNLDRRFEATAYAREFLEQRLAQLRDRLEESERALVQYASSERIVTVQTGGSQAAGEPPSERPIMTDDLVSLNAELNRAIADRIQAASRLGSGGRTSDAAANPALAQLRQQRATAAAEYANLLTRFSPEYPQASALASQIANLDQSIAREQALVSQGIQRDYRDAVQREQALFSRVEALKDGSLDLKRRNIQYEILKREADTNRQLYDGLLQRYKEIGVAGGVGVNNVLIVDPAGVPDNPSSPVLPLNIAIGLLLGLVLSGAAVFVMEQIDDAVKDMESARRVLPVPVLGAVPVSDGEPREALLDRKSALSEAYLTVQTSLRFTTDHGVPRSLAVTSTQPAEGKSTTTFALAHSLVRIGKKVALIDADMRSPSVHHMFDMSNERGLSNFMAGEPDVSGLIKRVEELGIDVMPAGPQPPNAAELLTSGRLGALVTQLLATYDHVIVDSPPVLGLADAPLIGSQVEAVVFAVETYGPKTGSVLAALARLREANANVVGAVLTKFEQRKAQYGYGAEYEYGYGTEAKA